MIPPKRFDISPLTGGYSEGVDAFRFFFKQAFFRSVVQFMLRLTRTPCTPHGASVYCTILYGTVVVYTPAAFPAGVDPNRGSEETVRSPGVL